MSARRVRPLADGKTSQAGPERRADVSIRRSRHIRDISDQQRAELPGPATGDAVADVVQQRNEHLALLLHELRNALAPIANALSILRMTHEPESKVRANAQSLIERQVGQLSHLMNDLQDTSSIDAGRMRFQPLLMDLRDAVMRSVEAVMTAFAHRRQEVCIALPAEPIWLHADPIRLEQVVVNLVSNAAKYTPDRGRIDITARQARDQAELVVSDNGIGIHAEMLPMIFDLYVRATSATDDARTGLGIGLNVVKRIVDLHRGTVVARSDGPGAGSEFVVSLPLTSSSGAVRERLPEASSLAWPADSAAHPYSS